jgi:hypothetical protein
VELDRVQARTGGVVSFPRNLYIARIAPTTIGNAVGIVDDVGEVWHEIFDADAWIADASPVPVMLRHDRDDMVVGHVVSSPVVSGGWHHASFQLDVDRPLASVAFDRLRHGSQVSIGARSIARDDNHLNGVRRHTLARFEHLAIVGPGEIAGYPGAKVVQILKPSKKPPAVDKASRARQFNLADLDDPRKYRLVKSHGMGGLFYEAVR